MHKIDRDFAFQVADSSPFRPRLVGVELLKVDAIVVGCRLQLRLSNTEHQRLQSEGLFGYQPELCTPLGTGSFTANQPSIAWLTLDPEQLDNFARCPDSATASSQLLLAAKTSLLRQAESWLLQSVTQGSGANRRGYRTLWDYLDWEQWQQDPDPDIQLGQFLSQFLQDSEMSGSLLAALNLPDAQTAETKRLSTTLLAALPELLRPDASAEELAKAIANLFQTNLQGQLQNLSATLTEEVENPIEIAQDLEDLFGLPAASRPSLLEEAIAFFEAENWPYERAGNQLLQFLFESEGEQWLCVLEAREAEQQLCFYSIGRNSIPTDQCLAIAQLFMTLNYHKATIGSFELDFQDGEFRYRTALDLTDGRFDRAFIKTLVHHNVLMMARYLPLIRDVTLGNLTLEAAIAQL